MSIKRLRETNMNKRLQNIESLVVKLRKEIFGNKNGIDAYSQCSMGFIAHQFLFNKPIKESEVLAFEKKFEIQLPLEYRSFLLNLGNGGAGPYYGLLPLEKWDWFLGGCEDDTEACSMLQSPCLLIPDLPEKKEEWKSVLRDEACKKGISPTGWDSYQGTITLCDQGCTYYAVLILNGPYTGRIVNIDMMGNSPRFSPYSSFLDWYEGWLNKVLNKEKIFWFGH
jgi:hypothetical protein